MVHVALRYHHGTEVPFPLALALLWSVLSSLPYSRQKASSCPCFVPSLPRPLRSKVHMVTFLRVLTAWALCSFAGKHGVWFTVSQEEKVALICPVQFLLLSLLFACQCLPCFRGGRTDEPSLQKEEESQAGLLGLFIHYSFLWFPVFI